MTPLVDVVLVLLIIFMVVAPRMDQSVPVDLPGILNPDPEVKIAPPFKLSMDQAGDFYIEESKYDLDGAIAALAEAHATEPERRLVLRADARLTYGQVRRVLARTQQVGFPGVSMMVGERARSRKAGDPDAPVPVDRSEPAAAPADSPPAEPAAAPAEPAAAQEG
ncbi:MAG: biopolymer transporter ExbD [Alphaproteobacteria bacterium]